MAIALAGPLVACASVSELDAAKARIAELEGRNEELEEQVLTLGSRLAAVSENFSTIVDVECPKVDGHVLDVSREARIVVLDVGEPDGVKPGYVFDVYRGSVYKALVRITSVRGPTSSGLVLSEKRPIAVGDSATTQL